MTELHENHFWYSRISQVAGVAAMFVIILAALPHVSETILQPSSPLHIGTIPAILAALTLVAAIASYFLATKRPELQIPLITQVLFLATTALLIHSTGGFSSHFLALWVPAVIFVGVFGSKFLVAAGLVPAMYSVWLLLADELTLQMGLTAALVGIVPVILSSLLFTRLAIEREDTSYKQLANQFSQVSDKSEVVITAITDGVIALDKQGTIELINPAAQRMIGWESRDALKLDYKSVLKLIDQESKDLTTANDPVHMALSTNQEVRSEEYSIITNSGKKILVSLVASPVGQVGSGIIIVFRDITKEKAEERQQAEFISTASHEMRTPVASIEGYLGLALNPATAQIDDKARSYIMKAHEVAQHLGRLFQDLLDITKAEDGRLSNNPRAVEVVTFVQDVIEGLRPQAEAKGLILIFKPIPDDDEDEKSNRRLNPVFYANVDNDHLREVISNLVENAIKYTKQGTISIDINGDDKQVEISIQDTGIGIPTEDLSHLFQKFYRVDNSDTREIGGTGLGLYLSRRLVEAMDGRIWAESQHGQGSTFFVAIPRISHQEAMELIETIDETPAVISPVVVAEQPAPAAPPQQPIQPQPAQQPAPLATQDGILATPSAPTIAAQLATPAATPMPATQPPQVAPVYAEQPQITPQPQPAGQPSGPPVSAAQQNPGQYLHAANAPSAPQTNANISTESQKQP